MEEYLVKSNPVGTKQWKLKYLILDPTIAKVVWCHCLFRKNGAINQKCKKKKVVVERIILNLRAFFTSFLSPPKLYSL
jgi:hypothetical protein